MLLGSMVIEIHSEDLKLQIKYLLDFLSKKKCPAWKKAKILEAMGNLLAEELMAAGVEISINPPFIKWSDDVITKPKPLKKGEKKGNYGICAKIVQLWGSNKPSFTVPAKKVKSAEDVVEGDEAGPSAMQVDPPEGASAGAKPKHVGIAARETKSMPSLYFSLSLFFKIHLQQCFPLLKLNPLQSG